MAAGLKRLWLPVRTSPYRLVGQCFRPVAGTVQYPQDSHDLPSNDIGGYERGVDNNHFVRAFDPTDTAAERVLFQAGYAIAYTLIHLDSRGWIELFGVIKNSVSILERCCCPFKPHSLTSFDFCKAMARRLAKCASTSSAGIAGVCSARASMTLDLNQASWA